MSRDVRAVPTGVVCPFVVGEVLAGRYHLDREIGTGGMGVVFAATDRETDQQVAVKVLAPTGIDGERRFARECELLESLDHPGIVRYLGHAVADGTPFLVEEWIEGCSLAEYEDAPGLTLAEAVDVTRRVANALVPIHARAIIHRDIKPSNILLVGRSLLDVKIIDFGVARRLDGDRVTGTGVMVGTPGYLAPEQARGERGLTTACDVFALGCLFYEAVTGLPPFPGYDQRVVWTKILLAEPRPIHEIVPGIQPRVEAVVARLLAKDPHQRPGDAREALGELDTLRDLDPSHARQKRRSAGQPTTDVSEEATRVEQGYTFVVLAVCEQTKDAAPAPLAAASHEAAAAVTPMVDRFEHVADGAAIAIVSGRDRVRTATRAADAALALRERVDAGTVVVMLSGRSETIGPLIAGVIERGSRMADAAIVSAIFADINGGAPPGVVVDGETAGVLGGLGYGLAPAGAHHRLTRVR